MGDRARGRALKTPSLFPTAETKAAASRFAKAAFRGVVDNALTLVALPLVAAAAQRVKAAADSGALAAALAAATRTRLETELPALALAVAIVAALLAARSAWARARRSTYLVDFYCYRPPDRMQTTHEEVRQGVRMTGVGEKGIGCGGGGRCARARADAAHPCPSPSPPQRYNKASIDFMDKVLDISGLGQKTFLPDAVRDGRHKPVEVTMAGARAETETVLFSVVDHVLRRNKMKATDVDVLIINCTSFNPVPSLR